MTIDRIAFAVSAALFALLFTNVAIGAARATPFLTDISEMLVLLGSSAAFVVGVLEREATDKGSGKD